MRQSLAALRAIGAELGRTYLLALLAEACGKVGQVEEGLNVLAEALAAANKTGERFYEAELYRLKGELTLQQFKVQSSKSKVENSLGSRVQSLESSEGKATKAPSQKRKGAGKRAARPAKRAPRKDK
jgi:predicted ATPase